MALYLTISDGRSGDDAQPIFASSDPEVIRAAAQAVGAAVERRMAPVRRRLSKALAEERRSAAS